jgi:hypothetical protein
MALYLARKCLTCWSRQGQGSALDPQRAGGPLIPLIAQADEVQGLGPSREDARRTRRVWAEPSLAFSHQSTSAWNYFEMFQ